MEDRKNWVVFKHGTIVVCSDSEKDATEYALQVLEEWGPVVPGTPLGDFQVGEAGDDIPGWVVHYPNPDILSYVSPDDVEEGESHYAVIGMIGRSKREADAETPEIIHVESD